MAKYGVPASHVVRHYDVTGKICPNPFVYNRTTHTWAAFQAALETSEPVIYGWNHDDQGRYRYRKSDGSWAANEWLTINHHWYIFSKDGYMLTGWQRWNGSSVVGPQEPGDWYFLDNTAGVLWKEPAGTSARADTAAWRYGLLSRQQNLYQKGIPIGACLFVV